MNNNWIRVEDRLPETDDEVLICIDNFLLYIGYMSAVDKQWRSYDGTRWIKQEAVSHWQPLPKLPTDESE